MNRLATLLLTAACLLIAAPVPAEEPHLDFVRGLRERGYADLALEYVQQLAKAPPAGLASQLPLEMARCRLAVASTSADLNQRMTQYAEAEAAFDDFLQKNPGHPRAAEARLDKAQVAVLKGKTQLSRVRRDEIQGSKAAEAATARQMLADAGKQLAEASKLISQQLSKYDENPTDPKEKKEKLDLENASIQADLDLALNYLDQAESFLDSGDATLLKERAKVVQSAMKILEKTASKDERNPLCAVARAWLGRCYAEVGEPNKARTEFAKIINDSGKHLATAQRLARYFRMRVLQETPQANEGPKDIQGIAELWLKDYPTYANSPEGFAVRFMLAESIFAQLGAIKQEPLRKPSYTRIKDLCKAIEATENDFQDKARRLKVSVINLEGGLKGDVTTLKTFDDCYIRSQYEAGALEEDLKKGTDEQKEQARKTRFQNMIAALKRGLELAKTARPPVPASDLNDARAVLAYAYLTSGELQSAVQVGEELAKTKPRPKQASRGALYALQAYGQLADDMMRDPKETTAAREGMGKLAAFMKETWPNDSPGDVARHRLGLLAYKEGRHGDVVRELAGVRPDYPDVISTRFLLAMSALELDKAKEKPAAPEKRTYQQLAVEALQSMPELPTAAEPSTAFSYFRGKLALGQMLAEAKKFDEMEKLIEPLQQKLADANPGGEMIKSQLRDSVVGQLVYAKFGQADALAQAGKHAEVIKVLGPVVDAMSKGELSEVKKNLELCGLVFGLALKAYIQDGKLDDAQKVMATLQKFLADNEVGGGTATLVPLVQMLKDQVDELRKKKDTDKLAKTKASFAKFLDALATGQAKGMTPYIRLRLAQGYASIDNYKKAAELLKAVPDPTKPEEKGLWEVARVEYVRCLRKDKQVDEAKKELDVITGTPAKPGWGQRNPDVIKESIYLLQDTGKFGAAAKMWNDLVTKLLPRIKEDPRFKEQYLECYFNLTYCWYMYAKDLPSPKKESYIKQAASFIVKLEANHPNFGSDESKSRFEELLAAEEPLKTQYEAMKATK